MTTLRFDFQRECVEEVLARGVPDAADAFDAWAILNVGANDDPELVPASPRFPSLLLITSARGRRTRSPQPRSQRS